MAVGSRRCSALEIWDIAEVVTHHLKLVMMAIIAFCPVLTRLELRRCTTSRGN